MTDSTTKTPIRVSNDVSTGPYIMLPKDQLDEVRRLLETNQIPFWVDHQAVSIDGKPAVVVINIGRRTNPQQVQAILDAAA
jgi:hypothetical protein